MLKLQLSTQISRVTHITYNYSSSVITGHMAPMTTNTGQQVHPVWNGRNLTAFVQSTNNSRQLPQGRGSEFGNSLCLLAPGILKMKCWMSWGEVGTSLIRLKAFMDGSHRERIMFVWKQIDDVIIHSPDDETEANRVWWDMGKILKSVIRQQHMWSKSPSKKHLNNHKEQRRWSACSTKWDWSTVFTHCHNLPVVIKLGSWVPPYKENNEIGNEVAHYYCYSQWRLPQRLVRLGIVFLNFCFS